MPKFVIERNMPGAGELTDDQLTALSNVFCRVDATMNGRVQWVETFVTRSKMYCIYLAEDEAAVRECARRTEMPVESVQMVRCVLDPSGGEIGDA